jgi:hypothetical protein
MASEKAKSHAGMRRMKSECRGGNNPNIKKFAWQPQLSFASFIVPSAFPFPPLREEGARGGGGFFTNIN